MNISEIIDSAQAVFRLIDQYSNKPHREMLVDPILYAYMTGTYGKMSRQLKVPVYGSQKGKRIDYRYGGSNPVVLEFAVRPPNGGVQLYGSQNVSELRKLCRVSKTKAKLRALLLLDLSDHPITQEKLEPTYAKQHAGRGKFKRHAVRVIYVSRATNYHFKWSPFQPGK